jgi:hypothetical protein
MMESNPIVYCGAWSPDGPARKLELHHVDHMELDAICQRAATSCIAAGIAPDSAELDEAIAATVFGQLEAIERDRDAKAQAEAEKQAKRTRLRLVDN